MLSMEELREIAKVEGNGAYYVSLYMNVNPLTNPKGEYAIWLKNTLKGTILSLDKDAARKTEKDFAAIETYVQGNKRELKKGLVIISSEESSFRRRYNLSVPVKNEIVVDKAPYIKPLLYLIDNYKRYAVLLVEKDAARIFVVHLGEITEYGEVKTPDVPGRHKKGGWYSLSQNHYERHIEYHVGLHLKEVMKKLEGFLKGEVIDRILIGGSTDAVSMTRDMLPKPISEKIIGTFSTGMFEGNAEILKKAEPVIREFDRQREADTVTELINRSLKNEKAVMGIENVLGALAEGRIMKLIFLKDYSRSGFQCSNCRALSIRGEVNCPYCGGRMENIGYLIDLAAQKAVEQDALVEVVTESDELAKAGNIGAFLRF